MSVRLNTNYYGAKFVSAYVISFTVLYNDYLPDFYEEVNSYWLREKDAALKNVMLVSLGGGDRDILVNYHTTRMDGLSNSIRTISLNVSVTGEVRKTS